MYLSTQKMHATTVESYPYHSPFNFESAFANRSNPWEAASPTPLQTRESYDQTLPWIRGDHSEEHRKRRESFDHGELNGLPPCSTKRRRLDPTNFRREEWTGPIHDSATQATHSSPNHNSERKRKLTTLVGTSRSSDAPSSESSTWLVPKRRTRPDTPRDHHDGDYHYVVSGEVDYGPLAAKPVVGPAFLSPCRAMVLWKPRAEQVVPATASQDDDNMAYGTMRIEEIEDDQDSNDNETERNPTLMDTSG